MVGLVLGRSSITTKGIFVQTGVIDSDYQGEIKSTLKASGYHIIPAQMHIAQLLLHRYLLSKQSRYNASLIPHRKTYPWA